MIHNVQFRDFVETIPVSMPIILVSCLSVSGQGEEVSILIHPSLYRKGWVKPSDVHAYELIIGNQKIETGL